MTTPLDKIRNYVLIQENIATSGQPRASQFRLISESGFSTVVNLAMPDHPDSISNEGAIVTALGMTYIHLPVPFDSPQPAHVGKFCGIMSGLQEEKVWVHCIMNYRVSAFMFHYLRYVVRMDEQGARSPMFDTWQPNETWVDLLGWSEEKTGIHIEDSH